MFAREVGSFLVHSIVWQQQSAGWVGVLRLTDDRVAKVVVVGSRETPKGAMIVCATSEEATSVETLSLSEAAPQIHPGNIVEIMCLQERIYGNSGLPEYTGVAD